jgi:hypothetical protein
MIPNGEQIFPFRSPLCMRGESDSAFEGWSHPDPLPAYEDHVMGVKLTRPSSDGTSFVHPASMEENLDPYFPSHLAFGPQSVVPVRPPTGLSGVAARIEVLSGSSSNDGAQIPRSAGSTPTSTALGVLVGPNSNRTGPMDFRFLPMPPPHHRIFHYGGPRGTAFTIGLTFPGLGHPDRRYRVYATMPVRVLHYRISLQVLRIDPRGIRTYVNGLVLFHEDTISDRNHPGVPAVATPYLVPNSIAEIRLHPFGPVGPAPLTGQVPLPPDEGEEVDAGHDLVPLVENLPSPIDDSGENEGEDGDSEGGADACGDTSITPDGEVIEISYPADETMEESLPSRRVSTRVRSSRKATRGGNLTNFEAARSG